MGRLQRRRSSSLLVRETRAEIEVWGPPAGVVEPGELLTEAVVREVNEETGLLVERIGPLGRSLGWGLAPHCSAGPAIRAVIGPSSR
ncbi:NUDIX hydrolase [Actinopolymorpha alba]|uniref:NUDIX domain-containing protein n=1 Tax=Actinopolymorpha alba TaxID=533267 RepID=UPI000A078D56